MTRLSKVWAGVLVVVVAFGLYLVDPPRPAAPSRSDLPAGSHGAALSVSPRQVRAGDVITLHITAPGADGPLIYGPTYEIDQWTGERWRYGFIGTHAHDAGVSDPFPPDEPSRIFPGVAYSGAIEVRVRVPDVEPGVYRVRKAFIDTGPGDDFELSAPFTVG